MLLQFFRWLCLWKPVARDVCPVFTKTVLQPWTDLTVQAGFLVWFRLRTVKSHYWESKIKMYEDAKSRQWTILYCFRFGLNCKMSFGTWARGSMPTRTRKYRFLHRSFLIKGPDAITFFSVCHPKVNTGNTLWKVCASIPTCYFVFWERKERMQERDGEERRVEGRERKRERE